MAYDDALFQLGMDLLVQAPPKRKIMVQLRT